MNTKNTDTALKKLQKLSKQSIVLRFQAQAHARAILRSLKAPEEDWPSFNKNLDIQLYYAANYQIWKALNLFEVSENKEEAKDYLLKGAETLEFLYKDSSLNSPIRNEELFKATLAYYISGHHARSYVMMKEIMNNINNLPNYLYLLTAILKKDLKCARKITLEAFNENTFSDENITNKLTQGIIEDEEAISRIIYYSMCKAVSFYLEYIKTGNNKILKKAFSIIHSISSISKDCHFIDWWWWSFCLRFFLEEYNNTNLWTQIQSFAENEENENIVKQYIRTGLRQTPPIIELWPSQVHSIPMINDLNRRHFCLKMPTSAGKTKIGELTILRFFLDSLNDPDKKCVYIAPFRSLAVEIEKTLRKSFAFLNLRISEIYGGFELTPSERTLIQETQILVVTPEKFDAILRYMPEIEDNIGLIIIDEGHIIDPNERGLRFEFFLNRLIQRYKNKDCRFLFI